MNRRKWKPGGRSRNKPASSKWNRQTASAPTSNTEPEPPIIPPKSRKEE